jgi:hypothetical protein
MITGHPSRTLRQSHHNLAVDLSPRPYYLAMANQPAKRDVYVRYGQGCPSQDTLPERAASEHGKAATAGFLSLRSRGFVMKYQY